MNEMNYSPIPMNYYPQYYSASSGGQAFKPVTTTTRKSTKPIVVNREDLVTALAGASDEYKKALEESNTLMGALGKSVSDEQVAKVLAAPTNKGRLESKMGWGQALSGALLSGLNTYGKLKQNQENKAVKEYEDALKMATMTETLLLELTQLLTMLTEHQKRYTLTIQLRQAAEIFYTSQKQSKLIQSITTH